MNPKEFSWAEDQQVTVTNPTEETYIFKVHNKQYELGAHKTAKMPGYIAWVFVYGLAHQICQAEGFSNQWNEEGFRQKYYDRLVKNIDAIMQAVEEEPEPEITTFDEEDEDSSDVLPTTPSAADIASTLAEEEGDDDSEPDQTDTPPATSESKPETKSVPAKPKASAKTS